jgi:hypothetical protein
MEVALVALIEWDNEGHMPPLGSQAKEADGIVCGVEGSDADGQAKGLTAVIEGRQAVDGVVTVAVSDGDDEGQLAGTLGRVGGELVEAVAVDPAPAIAVPAPEGPGVAVGAWTATAVLGLLAPVALGPPAQGRRVAGAELLAVGVGPGGELGAVAGDVEASVVV